MTIQAKYEKGVFRPLQALNIDEGTLVEVQVPEGKKPKSSSIRELGFTGMWAYRDDIDDGLGYVNRLRDNPRN